jgi:hypothetical protein
MASWRSSVTVVFCLTLLAAGVARADLTSGLEAYRAGDYATALSELQPLAEAGEADAQFALGEMYLKGLGVVQDFGNASAWFAKAAETGHTQAMANYGSLLALGLGARRDSGSAYFWLILSVVWAEGPARRAAMASLGEVAPLLSSQEKQAIGNAAARQWRRR